jgi:LEA14-like dessication related protein
MRKVLFILGISGIVGSLYWYFKKQLELALQYEYSVKDFKIKELTDNNTEVEATIKLKNKSSFEIEVLNYDIQILYKGNELIRTISDKGFFIPADSVFDLTASGVVKFEETKRLLLPFALNVLQQKPIKVELKGFVKVKFIGLEHTLTFENESFEYSSNLLKEYGLDDDLEKLKQKIPFLKK